VADQEITEASIVNTCIKFSQIIYYLLPSQEQAGSTSKLSWGRLTVEQGRFSEDSTNCSESPKKKSVVTNFSTENEKALFLRHIHCMRKNRMYQCPEGTKKIS
jgi:hypothetical protein